VDEKGLTIEQFLDGYNCVPWECSKVARYMSHHVSDERARKIATDYTDAEEAFEDFLDEIGFEFG